MNIMNTSKTQKQKPNVNLHLNNKNNQFKNKQKIVKNWLKEDNNSINKNQKAYKKFYGNSKKTTQAKSKQNLNSPKNSYNFRYPRQKKTSFPLKNGKLLQLNFKNFKLKKKQDFFIKFKRQNELPRRLRPKNFIRLNQYTTLKKFNPKLVEKNIIDKPTKVFIWQNIWNNLQLYYKSLIIFRFFQKRFLNRGIYLNKFSLKLGHNNLKINFSAFGIYKEHKLKKLTQLYRRKFCGFHLPKNHNARKLLYKKLKKLPSNYGKKYVKMPAAVYSAKPTTTVINKQKRLRFFLLNYFNVSYVKLQYYIGYFSKYSVNDKAFKAFRKFKKEPYFWESLQIACAVFNGYASASILGGLIANHTRRNPKRLAFVIFLKRLLQWHYNTTPNIKVYGVRFEIKGRFNPKSRSKKHIISCGGIIKCSKSSKVEYSFTEPVTKFGCLGIKVWICPKP